MFQFVLHSLIANQYYKPFQYIQPIKANKKLQIKVVHIILNDNKLHFDCREMVYANIVLKYLQIIVQVVLGHFRIDDKHFHQNLVVLHIHLHHVVDRLLNIFSKENESPMEIIIILNIIKLT